MALNRRGALLAPYRAKAPPPVATTAMRYHYWPKASPPDYDRVEPPKKGEKICYALQRDMRMVMRPEQGVLVVAYSVLHCY